MGEEQRPERQVEEEQRPEREMEEPVSVPIIILHRSAHFIFLLLRNESIANLCLPLGHILSTAHNRFPSQFTKDRLALFPFVYITLGGTFLVVTGDGSQSTYFPVLVTEW